MSVPCLLTKSHATCTETGCAYSMKYLSSIQVKQKIILILFTFNMLSFFPIFSQYYCQKSAFTKVLDTVTKITLTLLLSTQFHN